MPFRKMRLLALHGKGTSARIMKAQIKPIVDMLGDIVEVHYMDGGEISAPYQGIESVFPRETYYAWYQQPTRDALEAAHVRVVERLSPKLVETLKPTSKGMETTTTSLERDDLGVLTPPETPTSCTPASLPVRMSLYGLLSRASSYSSSYDSIGPDRSGAVARRGREHLVPGIDTPISCPSTAGAMTPLEAKPGSYDGLICFSQGCAVSTGMFLEMRARIGAIGVSPVRLAILICGGRPFDATGSMQRVEPTSVAPIAIPSIHIHGRQDAGLEESKRLASLYSDAGKEVIELDIGHSPPRRTSDVELAADAIRRAICQLG